MSATPSTLCVSIFSGMFHILSPLVKKPSTVHCTHSWWIIHLPLLLAAALFVVAVGMKFITFPPTPMHDELLILILNSRVLIKTTKRKRNGMEGSSVISTLSFLSHRKKRGQNHKLVGPVHAVLFNVKKRGEIKKYNVHMVSIFHWEWTIRNLRGREERKNRQWKKWNTPHDIWIEEEGEKGNEMYESKL